MRAWERGQERKSPRKEESHACPSLPPPLHSLPFFLLWLHSREYLVHTAQTRESLDHIVKNKNKRIKT